MAERLILNESIEKVLYARPSVGGSIGEEIMDKDRIKGSAKEIKGKIKEVTGKVLGDAKLESEGKAEQAAGRDPECCRRRQRHAQREVTTTSGFLLPGAPCFVLQPLQPHSSAGRPRTADAIARGAAPGLHHPDNRNSDVFLVRSESHQHRSSQTANRMAQIDPKQSVQETNFWDA